jgi:hypothetical protein
MTATETCENCARPIGNLETPRLHDGHVVCPECGDRLYAQVPTAALPDPPLGYESRVKPAGKRPVPGWLVFLIILVVLGFLAVFGELARINAS